MSLILCLLQEDVDLNQINIESDVFNILSITGRRRFKPLPVIDKVLKTSDSI
jgi:hypothetical protein